MSQGVQVDQWTYLPTHFRSVLWLLPLQTSIKKSKGKWGLSLFPFDSLSFKNYIPRRPVSAGFIVGVAVAGDAEHWRKLVLGKFQFEPDLFKKFGRIAFNGGLRLYLGRGCDASCIGRHNAPSPGKLRI
jgi:hypothetical protein